MIVRVQKYVTEVIEAGKFEDEETREVGMALMDTLTLARRVDSGELEMLSVDLPRRWFLAISSNMTQLVTIIVTLRSNVSPQFPTERMFNSHLQDVLMVGYLSNLVRSQFDVANRLALVVT
jgi:hypothetical protein